MLLVSEEVFKDDDGFEAFEVCEDDADNLVRFIFSAFSFDKKYDCMHYIFLCLKRHFLALVKRSVPLAYRISILCRLDLTYV